jgi:transcriptional regulator with XRE-family HTH domain
MPNENTHGAPGMQDPDDRPGEPDPCAELAELAALARVSPLLSLSRIPDDLAPEIRDLAVTMRVLFGALGMSLNRLAALLHSDPGTVSRYLGGKRIPPPGFIDGLCKAVYDVNGSLVTPQVQELVHDQYLVALRAHNPARYEVQRLTDLLQAAVEEKRHYEITVAALKEAIASRHDKIYALELETRQLRSAWARAEGLLDGERERLQQTIDSLSEQVSYFKKQLLSTHRRAARAEGRCRELEARLDAAGALLQEEDHQTAAPQTTTGTPVSATREDGAGPSEAAQQLALERTLSTRSDRPGWWHRYNDILPGWFHAYLVMEDAARSIRVYEAQFIPGLLQTEAYAAAVTSLGDFPPEQPEQLVMLRKERQRRFHDGKLKLWVILDEAALRRPVAGTKVQLEQLRQLRTACANPALTLQILPHDAGAHVAPSGFSILRFAGTDLPDIAYAENLGSALYMDKQDEVDLYMNAIGRLSSLACEPQETLRILNEVIHQLEVAEHD